MASALIGNNFILRADPDALGRAQMYCSLCKITFMASEIGPHSRSVDHTVRLVKHFSVPFGSASNPLFSDWHFAVKQTQDAFASKMLQSFWSHNGNDAATSTVNQPENMTSPATTEEHVQERPPSAPPAPPLNTVSTSPAADAIIIVECEGQNFPVNKIILSHASPVFSATFSNDMSERATNHMKLEDIPLRTLELLLHFIHSKLTGDEPEWENMESLKELLNASEKYQIEELKKLCFTKLYDLRTIDNAADLLVLIHLFQVDEDTKFLFNDFVIRNIASVTKTEAYKEKVKEHPAAFTPLLPLIGEKDYEENLTRCRGPPFFNSSGNDYSQCVNCGNVHPQPTSAVGPPNFFPTTIGGGVVFGESIRDNRAPPTPRRGAADRDPW